MEYGHRSPQAPLLKKKPSEYMTSGRIYYHAELWETMLPYVVERVGEDLILYASDYPHWDSDFPNSTRPLRERTDLTADVKARILGGNACAFYRLDA